MMSIHLYNCKSTIFRDYKYIIKCYNFEQKKLGNLLALAQAERIKTFFAGPLRILHRLNHGTSDVLIKLYVL